MGSNESGSRYCGICGTKLPKEAVRGAVALKLTADDIEHPEDIAAKARLRENRAVLSVMGSFLSDWESETGGAARVRETFPVADDHREVWALYRSCLARLEAGEVELRLREAPEPVHETLKVGEVHYIIITTGLIDRFDEFQIRFILGHEFGHILCEHVPFINMLSWLKRTDQEDIPYKEEALEALVGWSQTADLTADRAGFLCSGGVVKAREAILACGTVAGDQIVENPSLLHRLAELDHFMQDCRGGKLRRRYHPFFNIDIEQLAEARNMGLDAAGHLVIRTTNNLLLRFDQQGNVLFGIMPGPYPQRTRRDDQGGGEGSTPRSKVPDELVRAVIADRSPRHDGRDIAITQDDTKIKTAPKVKSLVEEAKPAPVFKQEEPPKEEAEPVAEESVEVISVQPEPEEEVVPVSEAEPESVLEEVQEALPGPAEDSETDNTAKHEESPLLVVEGKPKEDLDDRQIGTDSGGEFCYAVVDMGNHRLQFFSREGIYLRAFGKNGAAPGQFNSPKKAFLSGTTLFVSDFVNCRIQQLDLYGQVKGMFGAPGSEPGELSFPTGLAVDEDGAILVLDAWNSRVQKFDAEGHYISRFGISGSENGALSTPGDLSLVPGGGVWIADTGNNRLHLFDELGGVSRTCGTFGIEPGCFDAPSGIVCDEQGKLFVADSGNARVQILDSDGMPLMSFGGLGEAPGEMDTPSGLTVDPAGNIVVADTWNNRVQVFDHSGRLITLFGNQGTGPGELEYPNDILIVPLNSIPDPPPEG